MKKSTIVVAGVVLVIATSLHAHDLFLKLQSFFLPAKSKVTISLLNGTFDQSENTISRDRMQDVSIVGPAAQRTHPDTSQWYEDGALTLLDFTTGEPGTYVVGVSTKPRMIELSAEDFNNYLVHDGVLDVLEARKKDKEMELAANEKYSKHVKALIQVGDKRTEAYKATLGYPIEIVPMQNPYTLKLGGVLPVQVLRAGKPVANQLVYASYDGHHAHDESGAHREAISTRTDGNGKASITLSKKGRWYIRLIHMAKSDEEGVDYESNWATLTLEIK